MELVGNAVEVHRWQGTMLCEMHLAGELVPPLKCFVVTEPKVMHGRHDIIHTVRGDKVDEAGVGGHLKLETWIEPSSRHGDHVFS